jgi:16S rRNA (guanine966-N2)-methyltransferase
MRIIAGEFRRRILNSPPLDRRTGESAARPMPDRVRESLFALLRGHTEDAAAFDAFAGSGSVGLEAISRGARRVVFIEQDRAVAATLKKNIAMLGVEDRAELVVGDALGPGALARCPRPVHLVFMDPPYPLVRDPLGWRRVSQQLASLVERLDADGFAVLRTPWPFKHAHDPQGNLLSPSQVDAPAPREVIDVTADGAGGAAGPPAAGVPGGIPGGIPGVVPHRKKRPVRKHDWRDALPPAPGEDRHPLAGRGVRGADPGRAERARRDPVRRAAHDTGEEWLSPEEIEALLRSQSRGQSGGAHQAARRGGPLPGPADAIEMSDEGDMLDAELIDEDALMTDASGRSFKPVWKPVDLAIPGAVGPETHVYRHTAVHLYMRKK